MTLGMLKDLKTYCFTNICNTNFILHKLVCMIFHLLLIDIKIKHESRCSSLLTSLALASYCSICSCRASYKFDVSSAVAIDVNVVSLLGLKKRQRRHVEPIDDDNMIVW